MAQGSEAAAHAAIAALFVALSSSIAGRRARRSSNRLRRMPDDPKRQAAAEAVKAVQEEFLRQTSDAHAARRKVFEEAQKAGLNLREIGELAGIHHTTVGEIIRGR